MVRQGRKKLQGLRALLGEMKKCMAVMENGSTVPQKATYDIVCHGTEQSHSEVYMQMRDPKRCLPDGVPNGFLQQWCQRRNQPKCPENRRMDKQSTAYTHTRAFFRHKEGLNTHHCIGKP